MPEHNLPAQVSSFVGRTEEINRVCELLTDENCRLLTLSGNGGIGKTRLAIEVARQLFDDFPDGIYFLDLKSLSSAESIATEIADVLNIQLVDTASPLEQIINVLKNKRLLLLMDNFEHLPDGMDIPAEIVQATDNIKILVTSREALNVHLEWIHQVGGLDYPQNAEMDITEYSAVQLFAERARQVSSRFSVVDNKDCILRVCHLVEGMPLAIELATAWLKRLSCADIVREIEQNIDFLASNLRGIPERHRSIRAVFDYSWQLLSEDEQEAFMKFSVFRGGCTREAVEIVTGVSLSMLSGLVDKSLLRLDPDGRYDIHELLRQYVEEKLIAQGLDNDLQDTHCRYYLTLLSELEADVKGRRQMDALNEIEADIENIRNAWGWAIQQRSFDLIDISLDCLLLFYHVRTRWVERSIQINRALDGLAPEDGDEPHPVWYRLNFRVASFTGFIPSGEEIERAKQNLEIARRLNNPAEEAFCLNLLAWLLSHNHLSETILDYVQEAAAIYKKLGDDFRYAETIIVISQYYRVSGQIDDSLRYLWQAENVARKNGDRFSVASALSYITYRMYLTRGEFKENQLYLKEAYTLRYELKVADGVAMNAAYLSRFAILSGDIAKAKSYAKEALDSATGYGWGGAKLLASLALALIAISEENYEEALHLFRENSANHYYIIDVFHKRAGLALTYCGLLDFQLAVEQVQIAYSLADKLATVFQTSLLPPIALILVANSKYDMATECVGLAFEYPGSHSAMMQDWALIKTLISNLQIELGANVYHRHYHKGAEQDLEDFVPIMMREISGESHSDAIQQANETLLEPLTERELEILQLIADGLSNREMAKKLFVSLGTIKKHNNNIYGKLQVSSRTQAIAQAIELGLIS